MKQYYQKSGKNIFQLNHFLSGVRYTYIYISKNHVFKYIFQEQILKILIKLLENYYY
jgi:hypothetical protein